MSGDTLALYFGLCIAFLLTTLVGALCSLLIELTKNGIAELRAERRKDV